MSSKKDHQEPNIEPSTSPSLPTPHRAPTIADPTAPTIVEESGALELNTTVLPPPEGLIGSTLDGRYFVEKELGHGGIGAVYLARDRKLVNKPVVVKVLLEKSLQSEWAVRKFEQEKEALARVNHPGIVGVLDTGELPDGKPYIVMQYVDGVTLRSIMRPEGMVLDHTASLMEQICLALVAAHDEGILHRDLKPENIMVQRLSGGWEQIKIIDFGIAKVRNSQVASSTGAEATGGTIAYMSPERLRGEKATVASDVFALGVITYEMVTGRRPFNPETNYQLLEMQSEGVRVKPKDLRPALPDAAQAVILKALSFNQQERYLSAPDFGDDLIRAMNSSAVASRNYVDKEASTKDPLVNLKERKQRRLALSGLIVGVLLLAGIAGVGLWWGKSENVTQPSSSPSSSVSSSDRTLNYWLTVQKMRDGKPYQDTFESSGQEIFENGWKFRLNVLSPQVGNLYLLNEGPDGKGGASYNLLYPTPFSNSGSAQLKANQQMQTGWYVFDENQGTEKFWIVWSVEPVRELEAVKGVVNPQDKATIKDENQADAVREFLKGHSANKPEIEKDSVKKQTHMKGEGDILVNLVELEHH